MSSIFNEIVAGCAFVVMVVCLLLVFNKQYHDGFFGRIGLSLVFFAAFGRAANLITGTSAPASNIGALLWIGLAIFLLRHYHNFLRHKDKPDADKVVRK